MTTSTSTAIAHRIPNFLELMEKEYKAQQERLEQLRKGQTFYTIAAQALQKLPEERCGDISFDGSTLSSTIHTFPTDSWRIAEQLTKALRDDLVKLSIEQYTINDIESADSFKASLPFYARLLFLRDKADNTYLIRLVFELPESGFVDTTTRKEHRSSTYTVTTTYLESL